MAIIYAAGEDVLIREWEATVTGGVTVVLETLEELDAFKILCELTGQPPEDRMGAIFHALQELATSSSQATSLLGWLQYGDRISTVLFSEQPLEQELTRTQMVSDEPSNVEALVFLLEFVRTLWQVEIELEGMNPLKVAVTVATPSTVVRINAQRPALAFSSGSAPIARILDGVEAVGDYVVGFFVPAGSLTAEGRPRAEIQEVRQRRQASTKECFPLPDVRESPWEDPTVADKEVLVIAVHGLLGIDLGYFDNLLRVLNERPALKGNIVFAGFPHDTLASIETNALELCGYLKAYMESNQNPYRRVVFIAHSRGGLVVRCAAAQFYQFYPLERARLCGCITFGTPHAGAALATAPKRLLGLVLSFMRWLRLPGLGIGSCLAFLEVFHQYAGVEDLVPLYGRNTDANSFPRRLWQQEEKHGRIPLYAIGGNMQGRVLNHRILRWLLRNAERYAHGFSRHDWVVECESSLFVPIVPIREDRIEIVSSHFHYFDSVRPVGFNYYDATGDQLEKFLSDAFHKIDVVLHGLSQAT